MITNWIGGVGEQVWIKPQWPNSLVRGLFTFRVHGDGNWGLNVGLHVQDDVKAVMRNRDECSAEIGGLTEDWIVAEQVHSCTVTVVNHQHKGSGSRKETAPIPKTDALVTNESGITLTVMAADCVPLLFFDPVKRVIGVAHSGWKGTVGHISREVVRTFVERFDSKPSDIEVWMGPSIRQCCYEVNDTVAKPVQAEFRLAHYIPEFGQDGKYMLSLQACIQEDLQLAGVLPEKIHDTGVCTSCRNQWVFSHRADGGKTGRMMGAIRLV